MNRQQTYKEQEKESREAAMHNTITSGNKGFALLQKMGYKAGQGLVQPLFQGPVKLHAQLDLLNY